MVNLFISQMGETEAQGREMILISLRSDSRKEMAGEDLGWAGVVAPEA